MSDYVPRPDLAELTVNVPAFAGPLDLLLHLIRKHSMDIFDIPIVSITEKYLSILGEMQSLNLDVAGEFLLMAATLAEIKSRMLLPEDKIDSELDGDDGEDPRTELVRKLLEYKKFQEASVSLGNLFQLGKDVYMRSIVDDGECVEDSTLELSEILAHIDPFELVKLFALTLEKAKPGLIHTVQMEGITVGARISELIDWCVLREEFSFLEMLGFFQVTSRRELVINFLAILEMARLKLVCITQSKDAGEIIVTAIKENLQVEDKSQNHELSINY